MFPRCGEFSQASGLILSDGVLAEAVVAEDAAADAAAEGDGAVAAGHGFLVPFPKLEGVVAVALLGEHAAEVGVVGEGVHDLRLGGLGPGEVDVQRVQRGGFWARSSSARRRAWAAEMRSKTAGAPQELIAADAYRSVAKLVGS